MTISRSEEPENVGKVEERRKVNHTIGHAILKLLHERPLTRRDRTLLRLVAGKFIAAGLPTEGKRVKPQRFMRGTLTAIPKTE
jgi:hypothetical protein